MIDVLFEQLEDGTFDFQIENGDLKSAEGFDTSIFLSLLTDARAEPDLIAVPESRRGWLGDVNSPVENRKLGSLLWTLEQRRLTQENVNNAVDYARLAEEWFVEDGLLLNIDVTGSIVAGSGILLLIESTSKSGETSNHYVPLWEATGAN